jgi:hypothetical protein
VVGIFKWLEICPHLSNHDLANPPIDTGRQIPTLDRGVKREHLLFNLGI